MPQDNDRRRFDEDHDLLVKIHTLTETINKSFDDHMQQDRSDFETVHRRINVLSKYVYIGIGGIAVLEFALNYVRR